MAVKKLGVGIIGANVEYGWGMRAHLPAILGLPEVELVAVCTAHPATASASARHYGARFTYHDYREMARNSEVELVIVCVRVPHHYPMTMAALEAGKHVYCEWPLGIDVAQAEEMARLARTKGVGHMVGLQARGSPALLHFKKLVEEGYLGRFMCATMTQFVPGLLAPRSADRVWMAPRESGANTLTIATGHAIDAFCWLLGEITELAAESRPQLTRWQMADTSESVEVTSPDNVLVTAQLANGAVASVHVASVPWHGGGWRLEAYGDEGTLVARAPGTVQYTEVTLQGARKGENALTDLSIPNSLTRVPDGVPQGEPFNVAQQLQAFVEALHNGQEAEPDFHAAVRRHRLVEAIQRASDTRAWVSLGP